MGTDRFSHITFASSLPLREILFAPVRTPCIPSAVDHPAEKPAVSSEEELFLRWLLARGGLEPDLYRSAPLHRRLGACFRALGVSSCAEARQAIECDRHRLNPALDSVLLGVSEFFRDTDVFRRLRADILPGLARESDRLRVWSAGCSDGSELYSVAFLLAELGVLERAELLGTDCRETAVNRARDAFFDENAAPALLPGWERYLEREDRGYRISSSIRRQVRFERSDLFAAPMPENLDLLLCRNVAIYLKPEVARSLWVSLASSLRPGGYLITGKAERVDGIGLLRIAQCTYRKPRG